MPGDPPVVVRRSRRRRRTVTAYREDGAVVVAIPARFTRAEEKAWVATMLERLAAQERRRRPSDEVLTERAAELSERYLGGRARASSVRWATNQHTRWGSCTPADGTVRLSTRLRGVPPWVLDYVLLHELAHLIEPGHGPAFWRLLEGYPRTERARGYLDGFAAGRDLPPLSGADDDEAGDDVDGAAQAPARRVGAADVARVPGT
ncbi:M48 metallopeptidase family protein [Thalassiella azotivora]